MFRIKLNLLTIGLAALLVSSCSVKEDRGDCPSWLTVDYSGFGAHVGSVIAFGWNSDKVAYSDTCTFDVDSTGFCVHEVFKAPTVSTVLGAVSNSVVIGNRLMIPKGRSFDPLLAFCERVECNHEESVSIALPQKHYARIRLSLEGGADNSPYYFMFVSDVAGIDLLNLMPVKGEFETYLMPTTDEKCYIDVPRQFADSDALMLHALCDGNIEVSVNLASLLREQGFDWNATNLDDATVVLNYSEAGVGVKIDEWKEGNNLEIIY